MSRTRSVIKFMLKGTKPASGSSLPDGESQGAMVGYGDGLVKAIEVVFTPILFALIGVFLDYKFQTAPLLTLGFLFFGITGMAIKLWYTSFGSNSDSGFLQSGSTSARVVRRSQMKSLGKGELLGGDLEVPSDLDLTFDRGVNSKGALHKDE